MLHPIHPALPQITPPTPWRRVGSMIRDACALPGPESAMRAAYNVADVEGVAAALEAGADPRAGLTSRYGTMLPLPHSWALQAIQDGRFGLAALCWAHQTARYPEDEAKAVSHLLFPITEALQETKWPAWSSADEAGLLGLAVTLAPQVHACASAEERRAFYAALLSPRRPGNPAILRSVLASVGGPEGLGISPTLSFPWDRLLRLGHEHALLVLAEHASPESREALVGAPESMPLVHAAIRAGLWGVVARLLDRGVDVNRTVRHGLTPLMEAVGASPNHVWVRLRQAGGDIQAVDEEGNSVLHHLANSVRCRSGTGEGASVARAGHRWAELRQAGVSSNRPNVHGVTAEESVPEWIGRFWAQQEAAAQDGGRTAPKAVRIPEARICRPSVSVRGAPC